MSADAAALDHGHDDHGHHHHKETFVTKYIFSTCLLYTSPSPRDRG